MLFTLFVIVLHEHLRGMYIDFQAAHKVMCHLPVLLHAVLLQIVYSVMTWSMLTTARKGFYFAGESFIILKGFKKFFFCKMDEQLQFWGSLPCDIHFKAGSVTEEQNEHVCGHLMNASAYIVS